MPPVARPVVLTPGQPHPGRVYPTRAGTVDSLPWTWGGTEAAVETITLAEAATHLGISTKTARRWVKVGRLAATLHPGEHGPEYRVAIETLTAAQLVEPPHQRPDGANRTITTADQAAMLRALDSLPTLMATVDAIAADVAELRQLVLALASPAPAVPQPWWRRLFRR